ANIIEYGTFIIDITTAMINHRKQLTVDHLEGLEKIRVQAQELVTGCLNLFDDLVVHDVTECYLSYVILQ
ncbi:MAG: hypothetical protein AAFQ52_08390, partial [Chloroflexota bacterium]